MAQGRVFPYRRPATLLIMSVVAFGFGLALILTSWQAIDDFRGGTVDAEVVGITTNALGRRVYDVRLVTRSGLVCVAKVDSGSNPPPREIHLGGLSRVRYPASHPCADYRVEESSSTPAWQFAVVAALAFAGSLIALRQFRRER
jgi:hypothetical protein